LQVRVPGSNRWIDVAPATDKQTRLVVLVGAQLERATGGALKAVQHRIILPSDGGRAHRLALVFRLRARHTAVLNPIALADKCVLWVLVYTTLVLRRERGPLPTLSLMLTTLLPASPQPNPQTSYRITMNMPLMTRHASRKSITVAEFETEFKGRYPSITYGQQQVGKQEAKHDLKQEQKQPPTQQQQQQQQQPPPKEEQDDEQVQILIQKISGPRVTFRPRASDTIGRLKEMIQDREGFPPDQQRLIYGGQSLEDDRTLEDYGIGEYSVIHLLNKLRGD
jgi:ubiquitin-large subunit ribosomal protein L40e